MTADYRSNLHFSSHGSSRLISLNKQLIWFQTTLLPAIVSIRPDDPDQAISDHQ